VKRIIAPFGYRGTAAVPSQKLGTRQRSSLQRYDRARRASMRSGALVNRAVFRHLVIFHQTKAPIDQGLFVFVG